MSKRKKIKRAKVKKTRGLFNFGIFGKRKARKDASKIGKWIFVLKILVAVSVIAGAVVGLVYLEKYISNKLEVDEKYGVLELVEPPVWVNEALAKKVFLAASAYGEDLKLDDDVAGSVQQNIETLVVWLDDVRVQVTKEKLIISGRWRRPVAMVQSRSRRCYVDADLVVLDFVPVPELPIVQVKGLTSVAKLPAAGDVWQRSDLAAAAAILEQLNRMDELVTPEKPLSYEIDSIDVSNFEGRKDKRLPHILLYAKDDTEIIWGAAIGTWQRHLEATDEEKLAKLYGYYKENGTLLNGVKYINLRDPQDTIPQPIDKF